MVAPDALRGALLVPAPLAEIGTGLIRLALAAGGRDNASVVLVRVSRGLTATPMADPLIIKAKWRVEREIGVGGMGIVYEVTHTRLGRRRALKQLRQEFANREDIAGRFDKEALMMAELEHPHIVQVHDIDFEPNFGAYILMDLIEGSNLGKIIREQGARPPAEVLRIGREIASALDFAHRKGFVHRDIKPGNILIEHGTGRSVLTDFGIAKRLRRDGDETADGTRTGVFVGTYRYSCPEQMREEEPHGRWDIYSLGVVMYEATAGRRYLEGMTEGQIMAHVAYMPDWIPPLDFPTPPPAPLRELIEACIERDKERRVPTAAALIERIDACARLIGGVGPAPAPGATQAASSAAPAGPQEEYLALRNALREEVEQRLNDLQELESQVESGSVAESDGTRAEDLQGILHDISRLEERGGFEEALAGLETLRERVAAAQQKTQRAAQDHLQQTIRVLEETGRELSARAGPLLPAAGRAALTRSLAEARRAFTAGQWALAGRSAGEARTALAAAEAAAREAAEQAAAALQSAIDSALAELAGLDATVHPDVDVDTLRRDNAARLAAGEFVAAGEQLETARAAVAAALQNARGRAIERLREGRAALAALRADLDGETSAAIAAADLQQAERLEVEAQRTQDAGDLGAALRALDGAQSALRAAAARVGEEEARRGAALAEQLRALLAETESAPALVVGHARSAALVVLQDTPTPPRAAIAALQRACAELASARAELAPYAAAATRRAAAAAAQERVGRSAPDAERERAEGAMRGAAAAFDAHRWVEAEAGYSEAEKLWTETERQMQARQAAAAARRRAQEEQYTELRAALGEGLDALAQLEKRLEALAVPAGKQPRAAALRRALEELGSVAPDADVDGVLAQLRTLSEEVDAARTAAAAAVEEQRRRAAARANAAREGLERQIAELDGQAAAAAAPKAVEEGNEARAAGLERERRGEFTEAMAAYEQAARAFQVAADQLAVARRRERGSLVEQVQRLLAQSEEAPPALLAEARGAAQEAVRSAAAGDHGTAMAALRAAADTLTQRLAEAADFAAAETQRAAAAAVEERARALPVPARELRRATRLTSAAAAAFEQRQWADAAARYAEANGVWGELERQAQAEEEAEKERARRARCAALREEVDAGAAALAELVASQHALGIPGADAERAAPPAALVEVAELERRGELETALARLAALRDAVEAARAAAQDAIRAAVERARADLGERWQSLVTRAGSLLAPGRAPEYDRQVDALAAAVAARRWNELPESLAAAQAWLERIETGLRNEVESAARAQLDEVAAGLDVLARAGAAAPDGVDAAVLRVQIAQLLERGALQAASAAPRDAQAAVAAAVAALRRQQADHAAGARAALGQLLAGLDLETARVVAADAVARGDRARAAAAAAGDDADAAAAAYESAAAAYREADERLAALRAAALQELRALAEQARAAPAEAVGDALHGADELLAADAPAYQAMQDAAATLRAAVEAVPQFVTASAQRDAALAGEQRLQARGAAKRRLKGPRRMLRDAAAAMHQRQWAAAAQGYGAAEQAFAELERTLPVADTAARPRRSRLPLAAAAALLLVVAGGAAYWYLTHPVVPERVASVPKEKPAKPAPAPVAPPEAPHEEPAAPAEVQPPPPPQPQEPAQPVAPAAPHIASAAPTGTNIQMKENESQAFSIALADAAATDDIEWKLNDAAQPAAKGQTRWTYEPDFDAAVHSPYKVSVEVGGGKAAEQQRTWNVSVTDVNRSPQVISSVPPRGGVIRAEPGRTQSFKVNAKDADGDPLHYAWSVDGKPAGADAASLDVPAQGEQKVAVEISDGKAGRPALVGWQLAAIETPLKLEPQPGALSSLHFQEPQRFSLTVPREERQTALTFAWSVDGRTVSDAPTFTFANDDANLVRSKPVQISATAHDERGRRFTYDWTVKIVPPAPRISAASPPADQPVEVEPGRPQTLAVTAAPPVGDQRFTYVFESNGKASKSSSPTFELTPEEGREYTVVASIADNFGQRSGGTTWKLRPGADIVGRVRRWLNDYREALNVQDVQKISALLQLGGDKAQELENVLHSQQGLRVAFSDVRVEKLGDNRARASYQRVDEFTDPSGRPRSLSHAVEQTFRVANGRVQLEH